MASGTSESEALAERIALRILGELDELDVQCYVDLWADDITSQAILHEITGNVMDAIKRIRIDFKES